jgi:hypothetical protein
MHFEFLIEDKSGERALEILIPKILGHAHTYKIHAYRGIGHLPKGLNTTAQPQQRALLSQLPRLVRGYGTTFQRYPPNFRAALVLICDVDRECRHDLRIELIKLLNGCDPRPETYFCIAEEEGEAWFLGDPSAIKAAYPHGRFSVLDDYHQDAICGTWEKLADVVHPGGSKTLKTRQYFEIGTAKCSWAEQIAPHMDIDANASPSFQYFRDKLRKAVGIKGSDTAAGELRDTVT